MWDTALRHLCNNFGACGGILCFPDKRIKQAVWLPIQYRQVAMPRAELTRPRRRRRRVPAAIVTVWCVCGDVCRVWCVTRCWRWCVTVVSYCRNLSYSCSQHLTTPPGGWGGVGSGFVCKTRSRARAHKRTRGLSHLTNLIRQTWLCAGFARAFVCVHNFPTNKRPHPTPPRGRKVLRTTVPCTVGQHVS